MLNSKALLATVSMMAVTLAGCTSGGSGALDISVSGGADPLLDPFTFTATGGSGDSYSWDFGDGTPMGTGKSVDHLFGFSNGNVIVTLTACKGEGTTDCESVKRTISLGGDKNTSPVASFKATTNWATVGETVVLSGDSTTDADGDPILFRWTCSRVMDLIPPADGGGHAHAPVGVPFGVNGIASFVPDLSGGEAHGDDFCTDYGISVDQPWSQDGRVSGTFTEPGVYRIEVFIRDPKSPTWIGRLDLFVSETRPEPTGSESFEGTLVAGSQSQFEEACQEVEGTEQCSQTFDRIEHTFTVDIPNKLATIRFEFTPTAPDVGSARYTVKSGTGTIVLPTADSPKLLAPLALVNGKTYTVIVEMDGFGAQVGYTWAVDIENYLDPLHLYQAAP